MDALIGRVHFSAFEGLRRPEVVLHAYPLIFLLSREQKHSELAHLHLKGKKTVFKLKSFSQRQNIDIVL